MGAFILQPPRTWHKSIETIKPAAHETRHVHVFLGWYLYHGRYCRVLSCTKIEVAVSSLATDATSS